MVGSTWTCWPGRTASPTPTNRWTRCWRRSNWCHSPGSCPAPSPPASAAGWPWATAFVRPRKLLILDEPEQRLDVEGVGWLSRRLQAERQRGLAIVFASHEPALVETVATRVVELGAPRG